MVEVSVSGHESGSVLVSEVLDVSVEVVGHEGLHCVVELVLVELSAYVLEEVVRPVGELLSVEVPVVVDHVEAGFEDFQVLLRIQSILRGG